MIPVQEQPPPTPSEFDFEREVYDRGQDTIRQLAGLPPHRKWPGRKIGKKVMRIEDVSPDILRRHPHWNRAKEALYQAYHGTCAYLARYIEEGATVDHFVAFRNARDPMLAYTWSNFRLACWLVNTHKADLQGVLDPFAIEEGWFAMDFNTFRTVPGPAVKPERLPDVVRTIEILHLDRAPVTEVRRRRCMRYWHPPSGENPIPFWSLLQDEPFLASEMRRQGRLRDDDIPSY